MTEVDLLSVSKCRQLLGAGVFGRLGLCTPRGPVILPLNYSVVTESVVFRTSDDGIVSRHDWSKRLAFEVDHVDYVEQRGWSVLAVGLANPIVEEDELAYIRRTWSPRPWAGGERPLFVRLRWDDLTGRRLGSDWSYEQELPVRRQV
jgi:nitroimidazol reductase NimA-like FMN-containing flavoprotein (pyridoxamine 5'-phosphate oxidase superfamily)